MLFRHRADRRIDLYAENTFLLRDEKGTCEKGRIESNARFGPISDINVCKTHGRYSVEVRVPSLFEDQTTSWIKIVSGVEKYVREAMPIQEEVRASEKPAAKARPILKPSSTSNWNFIPMGQRIWIDIEVKRSKDHSCFQMSKFMTHFLRHKDVGREEDAGVRIVEECKDVLSDDSRYWSDEMKDWKWLRIGQRTSGSTFSMLCETKLSRKTPVPSSHSRSFRKSSFWKCSYQFCVARQYIVTKGFYKVYVSHRKRKRIEVNSA